MTLDFKFSGTSPRIMRIANPSAMAVLPTPGSPINTGLFLVLRDKICNTLLISSSLPITGSNLPSLAIWFRFIANFFSELNWFSSVCELTFAPPRKAIMALSKSPRLMPESFNTLAAMSFPSRIPTNKCSLVTNSSFISDMTFSAATVTAFKA